MAKAKQVTKARKRATPAGAASAAKHSTRGTKPGERTRSKSDAASGKKAASKPGAGTRSKSDAAARERGELLAARIDTLIGRRKDLGRIRMFGGLCFTAGGHMACGVMGDGTLCVRVGPEAHDEAMRQPHARPMDFTGKPMRGFIYVEPRGVATDDQLGAWVERGMRFARSLPPKRK